MNTTGTLSESLHCVGPLTPLGMLVAADLNSPLLKFRTSGAFSVTVRLSAEDAAPLIQAIDARLENIYEVSRCLDVGCPYEPHEDGTYLFKFTRQARSTSIDGRTLKHAPGLWDAKGRKLPKFYRIPMNSTVRISFGYSHEYRTGVGFAPAVILELHGVQTTTILPPARARRKRISAPGNEPPHCRESMT